jgi:hypothetical protein
MGHAYDVAAVPAIVRAVEWALEQVPAPAAAASTLPA